MMLLIGYGCESDNFVQAHLDRACAILEWREHFPLTRVTHLQSSYSNHTPILVSTQNLNQPTRRKMISHRFEEEWVTCPTCEATTLEAWMGPTTEGSPMFQPFKKIKQYR